MNSAKCIALIVPKWQCLNPHIFMKNDRRLNIFSNLGSAKDYLLNDIKKFCQKGLAKKSKKKPTRAQIFRYESRKNNFCSYLVFANEHTLQFPKIIYEYKS